MSKHTFTLNNLHCANCGTKIEGKINNHSQINTAVLIFATKKLVVDSHLSQQQLIPILQDICDSIEDGVKVIAFEEKRNNTDDKENIKNLHKKDIAFIAVGIILFVVGIVLWQLLNLPLNIPAVTFFVLAYLILGGEVLKKAIRNIAKGKVFDENFLMSIATLGALAIGEFHETVGVMLFFRVGELFEKIAVAKSRSQIMSAVDMRPEVVNIVKCDEIEQISAESAKIGDVILVRSGDRIPLDGTVISGESRIDTSTVTGESVPVKVEKGSKVLSGCVNTGGVLKISVDKVLKESMVTRILDSVENAVANKPKIDSFITRFSRIYTPVVVAVALLTAIVIPLITGQSFMPCIYTALSFLVMSCPCALVLSVPLAFFSGIGAASKNGILFKSGKSIEALAKIKAIVVDKTGTVTKGTFEVQDITVHDMAKEEFLLLCASCEQMSTHPIAESIIKYSKEQGINITSADKVEEISGKGIKAQIGKRIVLCGNKVLMKDFNIDLSNYDESRSHGTKVLVAVDSRYCGSVIISDTIKSDAKDAIVRIKKRNIFTVMLTGDEESAANNVAEKIEIDRVYAGLLPQDKLAVLKEIRSKHGSAMFVGDGINDAPVLAGADVGAAMGSGADAAIEAADVVFMNSNVEAIPKSIEISVKTAAISRQNVIFALAIKVIVMLLGITGIYSNMWLAVFADTGVAVLCILNSIRLLHIFKKA